MKEAVRCAALWIAICCVWMMAETGRAETGRLSSLDPQFMMSEGKAVKINKGLNGGPLTIHDRKFEHGLGVHASSVIAVDLAATASRFTAWVGVDDEPASKPGTVEFVVTGDGKALWRSGVMTKGQPATNISVDITGVHRLELRVTDGGDGSSGDHADWAEATIEYAGTAPRAVEPQDRHILTPTTGSTVRAPGRKGAGKTPPMGWNGQGSAPDMARAMKASGLTGHGWSSTRIDSTNVLEIGYMMEGTTVRPSRLTPDEQFAQIALACLQSAPLVLACDLERLDPFTLSLLTNDEVLDVDQTSFTNAAVRIRSNETGEVWMKDLDNGSKAVGLFNRADAAQPVAVTWAELGAPAAYAVRDLWRQSDVAVTAEGYTTNVPAHGVVLLKLTKMPSFKPFEIRDGIGNTLQKLEQGDKVTVAYFGGSITAAEGWRVLTTKWLKEQYTNATIEEVMASIGGTGSDLGVFRLGNDVLRFKPDLVFVEFAVNDSNTDPSGIRSCMEGIVRQIWKANPRTDIVFTYSFKTDFIKELESGIYPRSIVTMEQVAAHYGIPAVFFTYPVVELKKAGKLTYQAETAEPNKILFSSDGVHPHTAGHEVYAQHLREAFAAMKDGKPVDHTARLAARPIDANNLENAKQVFVTKDMLVGHWRQMATNEQPNSWYGERTGQLWESDTPGDKLVFRIKASQAKVYDISGVDAGQVLVRVNGRHINGKPMPRISAFTGNLDMSTIWCGGFNRDKVTTIEIEIDAGIPDRSPIAHMFKNPEEEFKKEKYKGRKIRVGSILLDGEIVTNAPPAGL